MRSVLFGATALGIFAVAVLAPACSGTDGGTSDAAETGVDPSAEGGPGPGTGPGTGSDGDGAAPHTPGTDASPPPEPGATCTDAKKNGDETDVDCGGSCPNKCAALKACAAGTDCTTGLVCVKNVCSSPAANDGLKDGDETDVDCGGKAAPPCIAGKGCLAPVDCVDKVCTGSVCVAAKVDDGVQNGAETDVDCGGGVAPACASAKKCKVGNDCTSHVCTGNICQAPLPTDGVKNANETDIDCGGGAPAPACGTSKACVLGTRDCTSLVCTGNVCKAATGTDGVKNGDESDKDCGGTTTGAPKCGTGFTCNVHADCASDGCDYNKKCAVERSCTAHLGGDTCGAGEIGEAGAVHESCCKTAPIAGFASKLDKYHVTAGRMRAFIERLSGNVRATKGSIPGWQAAWDGLLPSTVAEANTFLGSYWNGAPNDPNGGESKRSCQTTGFGGHTYYVAGAGELGDYAQTDLDPKALNCVGWHLAKAFCTWDHGRLATNAELASAFTNNAANAYPWQFADNTAYSSTSQDPRLVHEYSYGYPGAPRMVSGTVQDITWFIAPPGRRPLGANANGVNDIAGNLLHWVNDAEYDFTWTMSWEQHPKNLTATKWTAATLFPGQPNGYYAIGFRCAHD